MASYVSGANASANTTQGGHSQYPQYYSHTRTSQGDVRDARFGRFHATDDEHLVLSDDCLSDGTPYCGHSHDHAHSHSRGDGDRHRQRAPRLYEDPVPANIMVPTLSLEQLLEETSVAGGLLGGKTERDVEQLLEEFSALCPGDQITALRCMAASFYRDALFAPYACMHLIANRMRVHYAREVVHVAEDLADAMSANSGVCFRRYRKRVLEDMLAEEMSVYTYLARANADICEDNLLSAVETLLRRFRRMGCYRSLCMLKILALQHEDLAGFIRRSIRKTCNFAHARTHTVYV